MPSKFIGITNNLPKAADGGHSLFRRMQLIVFNKIFTELEIDRDEYFTSLCKQNFKLLAHSLLPQRRAFVENCIEAVILDPVRREVHIKLDISPFLMKSDDVKTAKKLELSEFDTSSEMVAGAGFEPTTFGL